MGGVSVPVGYCFNFYRYHHRNDNGFSMDQSALSTLNPEVKHDVLLGEFDLLLVSPVYSFEDYRNVSGFSKTWIGGRQALNLFLLDSTEALSHKDKPLDSNGVDEYIEFTYPTGWGFADGDRPSFTVVTCLNIAADIKFYKRNEYNSFLREIRDKILVEVAKYNSLAAKDERVACEIYGCLGSTELVIVWLSETFNVIPNIVDQIRYSKIEIIDSRKSGLLENVFSTSFCFVLFDLCKARFKQNEVAEIHIVENNNPNPSIDKLNKFISDNNQTKPIRCIGEFNYILNLSADNLREVLEHNDKNLYRPVYYENVLQHRIRIIYHEDPDVRSRFDELKFDIIPLEIEDEKLISSNGAKQLVDNASPSNHKDAHTIRKLHDKLICELYKKNFVNHELIHALDSLLCDYFRCMSISMNDIWYIDFTVQYKSFIEKMLHLTEYYYKNKDKKDIESINLTEYTGYLNKLTALIVRQIYHQSQANQLVIDVPNSHKRYTGQHDLILRAYYGVVKHLPSK